MGRSVDGPCLSYPRVTSVSTWQTSSPWGSSGRGSWAAGWPRWRPAPGTTSCSAHAPATAPRRRSPRSPPGSTARSPRAAATADERDAIVGRIAVTDALDDLADCDLVIESVVEDLATKQALFAELDAVVKPSAILATNTSTLPVVELAMATAAPRAGVRHPLLQPGADDAAGRDRAAAHGQRRDDQPRGRPSPSAAARSRSTVARPRRLRGQRPAVPVPQQRRAHARARHGRHGVDRHRDVRRVRLPDGPVRAARPGRPRHVGGDPRRPATPSSGDADYAAAPTLAPDGGRRPARPQDRPGFYQY